MFFPSAILPQKFLTTIGLSSFLTLGVGLGLGSTTQASFAQQASTYGLGMPGSASTGGATRGTICATIATLTTNPSNTSPTKCMDSFPRIILLSPEDGSRTSVSRPTFYWYVTGSSGEDSQQFKVTFVLRDGATEEASPIYRTELVTDRPGLYRFTLPSEVELKPGQPQRWQIRWQSASGSNTANANAAVMWQAKDPQMSQQLAGMNNLEKARWYKQNGYWYDAVAAYTLWLEQDNPKDTTARSERTEILNAGLATQVNLTKDAKQQPDPAKLEYFLQKLNDTAFANDLPAASTNELVP